MLDKQRLAERLRMERARKKVTQAELAKALGTSTALICNYENGDHVPSLNRMADIAEYYGVSIDDLIGGA